MKCARADLKLTLEPGEYWIGLTPIHSQANGFAEHLIAFGVRDARFDDVHRAAGGDLSPEERAWAAVNPTRPGEHLSIRIEGWHSTAVRFSIGPPIRTRTQSNCTCATALSTHWRSPPRSIRN